jgi:hypothetical protein
LPSPRASKPYFIFICLSKGNCFSNRSKFEIVQKCFKPFEFGFDLNSSLNSAAQHYVPGPACQPVQLPDTMCLGPPISAPPTPPWSRPRGMATPRRSRPSVSGRCQSGTVHWSSRTPSPQLTPTFLSRGATRGRPPPSAPRRVAFPTSAPRRVAFPTTGERRPRPPFSTASSCPHPLLFLSLQDPVVTPLQLPDSVAASERQ